MAHERQHELPSIIEAARALGLEIKEHGPGEAWASCPASVHANDQERPRCGLSNEKGSFNCLKCGASGDVVGLVKLVRDCDAGAAFAWLRETFGGDRHQAGRVEDDPIGYLARLRGWTVEALRAMGCTAKGRSVHFPMRDQAGAVTGWRIRRGDGSAYDGGVKALTQRGSKNGVIGVWPLPADDGRPVILTEGEADAAAAISAGWPAVLATPGATPGRVVKEVLQCVLAGRKVVMTPDPDQDGKRWLEGYQGKEGKWIPGIADDLAAVGCEVLYLPNIEGRDLDKRLRGPVEGRAAELARLVSLAIPWKSKCNEAGADVVQEEKATPKRRDQGDMERYPPFDGEGKIIPLGVAQAIHEWRSTLVCVGGNFWEFTGKIFTPVRPPELEADAMKIIQGKARRSNLGDVVHLLSVMVDRPDDFFGEMDGQRIAVQNGMIDVETLELLPHDARYRARNLLPVEYDPGADCPRFKQALEEWLPDDPGARALLVEWLGLCLVPDTRYEKALFVTGEGANGKGRYIRVLENLLGGRANISGLPLLSLKSDRTFPTAGLDGKLVNLCPESELPDQLDEGWIKSIISGDTISVEKKSKDPYNMRPFARFVIQSNNPPRINDKSEGIWRRLMIVKFTKTFSEEERDTDLDSKLEAELPGILNLALGGLHRLNARGRFDLTPAMVADLGSYRAECNPLATWKDDCVIMMPPNDFGRLPWTHCDEVYRSYRSWSKANGHHNVYARLKFTRELKRLGIEQGFPKDLTGKTVRAFMGVMLNE